MAAFSSHRKQRVVIAGGSGLIGTACAAHLRRSGYEVVILSRRKRAERQDYVRWAPSTRTIAGNVIDGAYAVINLSGRSLAERRWTSAFKNQLVESRILPARYLSQLIRESAQPPEVYIGASAVGIYGDAGQYPVYERDVPEESDRFSVNLVKRWEDAHQDAAEDLRGVCFRFGVVLTPEGGFLKRMLMPTWAGIYPYLGDGKQIVSWVHIRDLCRAIQWTLEHSDVSGIYNLAAPDTSRSKSFMRVLRKVRNRPGIVLGVPAFFLKLGFGELAEMLLDSCDMSPARVQKQGFVFDHPGLEAALRDLLRS